MSRVLAFDIGIKNLAWACLEKKDNKYTLLGWDNCNLLTDSSNLVEPTKQTCFLCKSKASFKTPQHIFCVRHCPDSLPALCDISGNRLKKLPAVSAIKEILQKRLGPTIVKLPVKRDDLIGELTKYYSLPLTSGPKVSKAPDANLTQIHDSIRNLVQQKKDLWQTCSLICLENQPVLKNPTMKSVQILLFATLRDILQPNPPKLSLVHAGKKVQGAEKGDAGYKERKAGSEARIDSFMKLETFLNPQVWKPIWESAKKKSDLADALCMCIDHCA